jgi:hypothetical protein
VQTKHFTALSVAGLLMLGAGMVHADREAMRSQGRGHFEFALIGDTPYIASNAPGTAYPQFDHLVEAINRDHQVEWVLHAGDIKNGSTACSDELFLDRLARLNRLHKPLVYTPGDNEWTDCHRINNGQYQPLERLARLRQIFFPVPGMTLGTIPMQVESQGMLPGYEEFPENVRWTHNQVVFATLHIVGSNNAQAPFEAGSSAVRTAADDAEVARRNAANLKWLNATFDQAERDGAPGILIMVQANPGLEFEQSVADRNGFEAFLTALENRTANYGKPVVLAHGDSHFFRVDKPRLMNRPFLRNLTRVETFGAGNVHWIRVSVDPRSEQVFSFEQQIVNGNP